MMEDYKQYRKAIDRIRELKEQIERMKKGASKMLDLLGDKGERVTELKESLAWALKAGDMDNIAWDKKDMKKYLKAVDALEGE